MRENGLPEGWDDGLVLRVIAHYEGQTGNEAVLEDEAWGRPEKTVMSVPHELVPEVRELIAKRKREGSLLRLLMLLAKHLRIIHARAGLGVERVPGLGGVEEFGADRLQRVRREIGRFGEAVR